MKNVAPAQLEYKGLDDARRAEAHSLALEEAHRTAKQATRVAPYVVKWAERGYHAGYPSLRRIPAIGGLYRTDLSSLELATNAELKASGKDVIVEVEDGTAPADRGRTNRLSPLYVVKSIDGKPIDRPYQEPEPGKIIKALNNIVDRTIES